MQPEPRWGTEIAAAFVAAQAEMPEVTKGRTANVGTYSYTYADLGDVLNAVRPTLVKHGLAIAQDVSRHERMIEVFTLLVHKSGESVSFGPMGFESGSTPQASGSAVTYARRYSLLAALGLATEDDDGQSAAKDKPQPVEPPQYDPSIVSLFQRIEAVKGTPVAHILKAFAASNNLRLNLPTLAADRVFASQIEDILDKASNDDTGAAA